MTVKHQIAHKLSPSYVRELGTGMVAQVLQDGMVHLTFYRDASTVTSENFTTDTDPTPGQKLLHMKADSPPVTTENFREDLFTVIVPAEVVTQFAGVLNKIPGVLAQQLAAQQPMGPREPQ